jgi:hypothetical protein
LWLVIPDFFRGAWAPDREGELTRNLLSFVCGLLLAWVTYVIFHVIGDFFVSLPTDVNVRNVIEVKSAMAHFPTHLLGLLAGRAVGIFDGTVFALRTAKAGNIWTGIAVSGVVISLAGLDMLSVPHPIWFWVGSIIILPSSAILAFNFVLRKNAL